LINGAKYEYANKKNPSPTATCKYQPKFFTAGNVVPERLYTASKIRAVSHASVRSQLPQRKFASIKSGIPAVSADWDLLRGISEGTYISTKMPTNPTSIQVAFLETSDDDASLRM